MRLWLLLAAFLLQQVAWAQAGGNATAFEAGKALGQGSNQGAFSGITAGAAQEKIPRYGAPTPEANYFAGGKGVTSGPGVGKINACASYAPGPDKIANQECEAVNFLARNPQVRPQFNITKNDPMIQKYKQLSANAEQIFAQFFPGGQGSHSACTTKTETMPGQYSTETCVSSQEVGTNQCTMGRIVNIDADSNFQCEQTVNAYETRTCERYAIVSIQSSCAEVYQDVTASPPLGHSGHIISTFDDFRLGPTHQWGGGRICNWIHKRNPYAGDFADSGVTAVGATCFTAQDTLRHCSTMSFGDGYITNCTCDAWHNGSMLTSNWGVCPDQGWCYGYGVKSITCRVKTMQCTATPVITWADNCGGIQ